MDNWGGDEKRGIYRLMGKIAWLSPVIFSNSKNGKPVVQVKNTGALLLSSPTPHPILSQVLYVLPSKYVQNPTTSHHLPNYPLDSSYHYLLPSYSKWPSNKLDNFLLLIIVLWLYNMLILREVRWGVYRNPLFWFSFLQVFHEHQQETNIWR